MSMEITNGYSSYANYAATGKTDAKNTDSKKAENASARETTASANSASSVAAGMSYLQNLQSSYSGVTFLAGTASYGQAYGNSTDVSFVVNPIYLAKLGTDSEARSQFEEDVEYLYNFSQNFRKQQAANGWEVISEGWFCDENGNWGGWCAVRKTNAKSFLQKMQEKSDKIMEEKMEKRQELKELDEKRKAAKAEMATKEDKDTDGRKIDIQESGKADKSVAKTELKAQIEDPLKEYFGDRFKGCSFFDDNQAGEKAQREDVVSVLLDIKA